MNCGKRTQPPKYKVETQRCTNAFPEVVYQIKLPEAREVKAILFDKVVSEANIVQVIRNAHTGAVFIDTVTVKVPLDEEIEFSITIRGQPDFVPVQ
jgi:hypothetical protein